jgi:AraC-like DNA-binding protein
MILRGKDRYTAVETARPNGPGPSAIGSGTDSWLATTLDYAIREATSGVPGNATMLERLTELLFVEILRQYMRQLPEGETSWLAGLNDPYIGRALRLMHEDPKRDWTVEALSRQIALSRSALAQRFTDLVGQSPMRYLTRWRIELAKQMLKENRLALAEIGERVGYESEAAFNRAFKRITGSPPAAWRNVRAAGHP